MEITWLGHACFRLKGKDAVVVTDPYGPDVGYGKLRTSADIVTLSHEHFDHNYVQGVSGEPKVIRGPGEYEIKGVFITGLATFHDDKQGQERGRNTVYWITIDDVVVCHLGDLGYVLSQAQVEEMAQVDVLLVPVGGFYTINAAQATEVVSLLQPKIVIPMHFKTEVAGLKIDPVDKFYKEMGLKKGPLPQPKLAVAKANLPEETQVVALDYKRG